MKRASVLNKEKSLARTFFILLFLAQLAPFTIFAATFGDFIYISDATSATITGYTGPGGTLDIPSNINGQPVTSIGNRAFYDVDSLINVTIPDSVGSIEFQAFAYCSKLTSVIIGNNVTSIAEMAFYGCIGLTTITVAENNPAYSSIEGVLFNKSLDTLIQYPQKKVGSYEIPSSVINIGKSAFLSCESLTAVTIPASVTEIRSFAFAGCESLTSITIPYGITEIDGFTFTSCTKLNNVTIPGSVTEIGVAAFKGCTSLPSITIPTSVANIEGDALRDCTSLIRVYFLGNVPNVDEYTFLDTNDAIIYYLPGTTGWGATLGGRPTVLLQPLGIAIDAAFGVQTNGFFFNVAGMGNDSFMVEARTDLISGSWIPLGTNNLVDGAYAFSDPEWTNYPMRMYRVRPVE